MKYPPSIVRALLWTSLAAAAFINLPPTLPTQRTPQHGPESSSVLEEVVVTAQKRTENILSVPISITAVSQANLEALEIKDITDISRIAPGVSLLPGGPGGGGASGAAQSTGGTTVVIRGISATAGSATTGFTWTTRRSRGENPARCIRSYSISIESKSCAGHRELCSAPDPRADTVHFVTPATAYGHEWLRAYRSGLHSRGYTELRGGRGRGRSDRRRQGRPACQHLDPL